MLDQVLSIGMDIKYHEIMHRIEESVLRYVSYREVVYPCTPSNDAACKGTENQRLPVNHNLVKTSAAIGIG